GLDRVAEAVAMDPGRARGDVGSGAWRECIRPDAQTQGVAAAAPRGDDDAGCRQAFRQRTVCAGLSAVRSLLLPRCDHAHRRAHAAHAPEAVAVDGVERSRSPGALVVAGLVPVDMVCAGAGDRYRA